MVFLVGYMRRIARMTREALAAIERQASSQHATLASGIDAIAVEVERLGEGQRFMSKALAGPEAKTECRSAGPERDVPAFLNPAKFCNAERR